MRSSRGLIFNSASIRLATPPIPVQVCFAEIRELGVWKQISPQAINDNGWVTGSCTRAGQSVGFLWRK